MRNRSKARRTARSIPSETTPRNSIVPLSALRPGERGVVTELSGGREMLSRVASLGFTPGAEVTIMQNFGRGPIIARVRDARIALGRGEASKIRVRSKA